MTIIRINHTSSFTTLSNKTLWDKDLSLEAIGLLGRLLSKPPNWQVHVTQLADSCGCSPGRIRRIIRQLIETGYVVRQAKPKSKDNRFKGIDYTVYEERQTLSQNNFPQVGFPHAETPHAENGPLIKKENRKDGLDKTSSLSPQPPATALAVSKESPSLACHLLAKITEMDPSFRQRNIESWVKDIDLLIRRDGRSAEEVRAVIDWVYTDPFWKGVVLSASKLRKQFNVLHLKMVGSASKEMTSATRDFAKEHLKKYRDTYRSAKFLTEGIQNANTGEIVRFDIPLNQFSQMLPDAFMTANGYAR